MEKAHFFAATYPADPGATEKPDKPATSLYDDPAAGLCGDAPAGLDEHPEHAGALAPGSPAASMPATRNPGVPRSFTQATVSSPRYSRNRV